MHLHSTLSRKLLAGATAVGLSVTLLGAGTVAAQEASPSDTNPRLARVCLRVANLTTRTENVITRINGDADTRGSLVWLDGRIAAAEESGRTDLAEALRNRRAVRAASLDVLDQRLGSLASIAERCRNAAAGL